MIGIGLRPSIEAIYGTWVRLPDLPSINKEQWTTFGIGALEPPDHHSLDITSRRGTELASAFLASSNAACAVSW